ncbi:(2Fe-2S)-binding protein [uncultured Cohaesibacter sp.]|uniref:(2Fe-2S)-binding protein n=1 Tax=uncultured Cohaesibacter sp. TaxID=1002546 RepID=UPI002931E432|nr:(2Fe-2S)-binding protein [uncultured Cohaesibacter sp.]
MKIASDFHNISDGQNDGHNGGIDPDQPLVPVHFDGQDYMLPEGANLAASLLAAGVRVFRKTPVSASPRGPFCMMGVCYDCLVEIDGMVQQACQTFVKAGMIITMPARPTDVPSLNAQEPSE